jgi:hypothetical protein
MVNRVHGDSASQLRERHEASDFDTKTGVQGRRGGVTARECSYADLKG